MKNFIQKGDSITIAAPATVTSGAGVQIGSLFGVASTSAESGAALSIVTMGVFDLPKEATTDTFDVGDPVEWDGNNSRIAALDAGERIGITVAAAGATEPSVAVRIG